jgi:hypothetical protein
MLAHELYSGKDVAFTGFMLLPLLSLIWYTFAMNYEQTSKQIPVQFALNRDGLWPDDRRCINLNT